MIGARESAWIPWRTGMLKYGFRNWPVARKITVSLLTVVFLSLLGVGAYSYFSIFGTVEHLLGEKLDHIARTASLLVSVEDHKKLEEIFKENPEQAVKSGEFARLRDTLRLIKKQNDLKEDIYTVIAPDWAEGNMIFMAMTNAEPYVGNAMPANENVLKALKTGRPQFSGIYKDHEGEWVSAFAPLIDKEGQAVGVFEVDFQADRDIWEAKVALMKSIGIPALLAALLALIAGTYVGRQVTAPIHTLTDGAKQVASGDLKVQIVKQSNDEIGFLTDTFNSMVEDLLKSKQKLEDYAKNLEKMVEERTQSLREAKAEIETLLDNLGQGFMVIDRSGVVRPGSTRAAAEFFGVNPTGRHFSEVLRQNEAEAHDLREWLEVCFGNQADFGSMATLGPESFEKEPPRYVHLNYKPIFSTEFSVDKIICIAEDKTKEKQLARNALEKQEFAGFVVTVIKDKVGFVDYINGTFKHLNSVKQMLDSAKIVKDLDIDEIFRHFHTLKGEAAYYHVLPMKEALHTAETKLADISASISDATLDSCKSELLRTCGELRETFGRFLSENKDIIGETSDSADRLRSVPESTLYRIGREIESSLGKDSTLLKDYVEKVILEPADVPLLKFSSLVSNLARQLSKRVHYSVHNDGVYIPMIRFGPLVSSMVHVFRNAVDHGIELPEERVGANKADTGAITVRISENREGEGGRIRFAITDDGRGINHEELLRKALEREIVSQDQALKMARNDVLQLVFAPGLSTSEQVTDVSGRGIGMDAIKNEAQKLGGRAWVDSEIGKSTTVYIEVPVQEAVAEIIAAPLAV